MIIIYDAAASIQYERHNSSLCLQLLLRQYVTNGRYYLKTSNRPGIEASSSKRKDSFDELEMS